MWHYVLMILTSFESDGITPVYFSTVKQHEDIFRGTLLHAQSELTGIIPEELDIDAPIEALLEKCNPYRSLGRFAVEEFFVGPRGGSEIEKLIGEIASNKVILSAGDIGPLYGKSGIYEYDVSDNGVTFSQTIFEMRS